MKTITAIGHFIARFALLPVIIFCIGCSDQTAKEINRAKTLLESGKFLEAKELYRKLIADNPVTLEPNEDFLVHYGLGMSICAELIFKTELGMVKPQEWFEPIYHMSIAMNNRQEEQVLKTLGVMYFNLAACYKKENNAKEAIRILKQSINYDPGLLKALNLLGALYHEENDLEHARIYYEKAIQVNPRYALCYFNIAVIDWQEKEYKKAHAYFVKALEIEPDNPLYLKWVEKAKKFQG